jgi:NAD+ synthase
MNYENVKKQLINFLKTEVKNAGLERVTVGLSGGLDSAVVAILCKEAFGDNMSGVLMPSQHSSDSSIEDAKELCEKYDIKYEIVNIAPMVEGYFNNYANDADSLRIGNLSARMRMSVLYDISARDRSLVVGTSNKSELLLGYGTIFGDIACAINPLGEMYKSDEFEFAAHIGVTDAILNKKPSADLWEGQSDEEEMGYSYATMDRVLKKLVDENISKEDLVANGEDEELLNSVIKRMKANEFKGKLPTIAKIDFN